MDIVTQNISAKGHLDEKLLSGHTDTHTHRPIALPGSLKWSVICVMSQASRQK